MFKNVKIGHKNLRENLLKKFEFKFDFDIASINPINHRSINQIAKFSFSNSYGNNLYIPNKPLIFINHPKHGRVYPVYIADEEYYKKYSPKKYWPFTVLISGFNLFFLFSGLQLIPMTHIYSLTYQNDMFMLTSFVFNYILIRKYFQFMGHYDTRVKSLYLLPSGDKIILETFDGTIKRLENFDIYEYNIRNKWEDISTGKIKWNTLKVTNDNSFRAFMKWGRASQNYFEGRTKVFDYEILSQILARTNIETNIIKFRKTLPLGYYTQEEKLKVLKNLSNRFSFKKIDRNRLSYWYKILRKKYVHGEAKKKIIDEKLKLY
jgi:hypothetical protein